MEIHSVQWTGVRSYSRAVEAHDVRMVLQSLVVALIHNPKNEGNGCSGSEVSERVS